MYVDLPPEGVRTRLLALLYAFWRLEIARLKQQIGTSKAHRQEKLVGGFFVFGRIVKTKQWVGS
jgi:hypothetical protein